MAALALVAATSLCAAGGARGADKTIDWKPAEQAILRVDGRPVDHWNVFQDGKKTNPLLLEIGKRFLLIDSHEHKVFELNPATLKRKGDDLYWKTDTLPRKPLNTSNWIVRDVGLAYEIRLRLVSGDHLVNLQLPHPLDIRSLY